MALAAAVVVVDSAVAVEAEDTVEEAVDMVAVAVDMAVEIDKEVEEDTEANKVVVTEEARAAMVVEIKATLAAAAAMEEETNPEVKVAEDGNKFVGP